MSKKCKRCKTENKDNAEICINTKCNANFEIMNINILSVSDNRLFKTIAEICHDFLGLRTKNGNIYEKGAYKFGKSVYEKSANERVWFPKIPGDDDWDNKLYNKGKILIQIYKNKEKKPERRQDVSENNFWYAFPKFENGYRFVGKFKVVDYKLDADGYVYETVYEKVSDIIKLDTWQ